MARARYLAALRADAALEAAQANVALTEGAVGSLALAGCPGTGDGNRSGARPGAIGEQ